MSVSHQRRAAGRQQPHEQVVERDLGGGRHSIIAVHSTRLGPSLGGTRFYPYASRDDALADVLRLSRAMSYKSAAANLDLGGGKAVIIGDPHTDKSDDLFREYGRFVDSLDGAYVTTEDVGTTVADMEVIHTQTKHVTGFAVEHGGSGDPSEATGWGVFSAMRTLAKRLWSVDSLEGKHVAIKGVGKVGTYLAGHVAVDGAKLTVADIYPDAAQRLVDAYGASVVAPDEIHAIECDIYAPCALAGDVNARTIPAMRSAAVCGCANNQLDKPEDAERIAQRGIVYAPDFIVNAGGVINISHELVAGGYDKAAAMEHTWRIGHTLARVLDEAEASGITTEEAAERVAEERLLG
jgi:leucine dehydrogenase